MKPFDIIEAATEDLRQLRLTAEIDHKDDSITLRTSFDHSILVTVHGHAFEDIQDPSRVLIEVARAVVPSRKMV
jgi:hypothetical protein